MKELKKKSLVVSGVMAAALLLISMTVFVQSVQAAGEAKQYVQLNARISLADNLTALKGKTTTIYLSSGQSLTGIVKDVEGSTLHLEKISQKEFYDALIRIDMISAIEARAR